MAVERSLGGGSAAVNVPMSVQESFAWYNEAITEAGFEILMKENEGFEAETYFRGKGSLGSVQIQSSRCDNASFAKVSLVPTKNL